MAVILIGTLDTKGQEIAFVDDLLKDGGVETIVVDAGSLGTPAIPADIHRQKIFEAAGTSLAEVQEKADRGVAISAAAEGVRPIVLELFAQGKVDGVLSLGGSAGTTIGTSAMRALPFGVPKLMVSTMGSGQVRPFVGPRDILMLHSVTDISGINRISRTVLSNAAGAMIGMVRIRSGQEPQRDGSDSASEKPLLTATMFGVTTPCVEACRSLAERQGYETLVFHAVGTGGEAMESLIADGLIAGVLDVTTTELADELVGGILSAGPNRLTAAGKRGIPQVISVGALDMVNFGPRQTVPDKFSGRNFYVHNQNVTLMRTTAMENSCLGAEVARKASQATGPVAILVPLKGVSAIDMEGKAFWDPQADEALWTALGKNLSSAVELIELDLHINDPQFAQALVEKLLEMLEV